MSWRISCAPGRPADPYHEFHCELGWLVQVNWRTDASLAAAPSFYTGAVARDGAKEPVLEIPVSDWPGDMPNKLIWVQIKNPVVDGANYD